LLVISIKKKSKSFFSFGGSYDNGISFSVPNSYSVALTQSNLVLLVQYHLLSSQKTFSRFSPKITVGKTAPLLNNLNNELEKDHFYSEHYNMATFMVQNVVYLFF
jgi:hypothetical protein